MIRAKFEPKFFTPNFLHKTVRWRSVLYFTSAEILGQSRALPPHPPEVWTSHER